MIEKELLTMVHAINKFRHYIIRYLVYVHIDHFMIRYLMNKFVVNARVIRWILPL